MKLAFQRSCCLTLACPDIFSMAKETWNLRGIRNLRGLAHDTIFAQ